MDLLEAACFCGFSGGKTEARWKRKKYPSLMREKDTHFMILINE